MPNDEEKRKRVERLFLNYYQKLLFKARKKLIEELDSNYEHDAKDIVSNVFLNILKYPPDEIVFPEFRT